MLDTGTSSTERLSDHIQSGGTFDAFETPFAILKHFGEAMPMQLSLHEQLFTRKATMADLPQIKRLAARNSEALGFVLRPVLAQAIAEKRLIVAEIAGRVVGFQEYYHRKRDGQTTLYHKCVEKSFRRSGIGKALVDTVVAECRENKRQYLLLKCPEDLPANKFHESYGFFLTGTENGRKRRLNVWRFDL